ncbi:MAG: NAD-dependent epimerase/dehydratase family protein [Candidatus Competibacteraceae bacterium]|jgi:nucleoside-diphosphate-sugar epimerase|nr:NAD-dependent epimerase/dehydratase family protein [Candidatus Competibacteraceae bacterium]
MVLTGSHPQPDFFSGRPVLVTGGTGFIGSHLIRNLLQNKAQVRVLVRPHSTLTDGRFDVHFGDLENADTLLSACHAIDTVFHVAGFAHAENTPQTADYHWRINAEGTRRLLDSAVQAGVKRFIFLSSVLAAGPGGPLCINEQWPLPPQTPYGKAKRAAENWVLDAGKRYPLHVANLRPALVYGAGVKGNLKRLLSIAQRNGVPALPDGGKRSMIHVEDVSQAALLAAAHPAAHLKTYILTDGQEYSSQDIINLTRLALGKPPPVWQIPRMVLSALAKLGDCTAGMKIGIMGFNSETFNKLLGWSWYSSEKIQRELGFQPIHTLAAALSDMMETRRAGCENLTP